MARLTKLVNELSAPFALAVPREETDEIAPHLAFFQRLVAMLQKRLADETEGDGRFRRRDVDAAVRQLIGGAVHASEVIDLFAAAGLESAGLDTLSEDFLRRVSAVEQKNLALETLRPAIGNSTPVFGGRQAVNAAAISCLWIQLTSRPCSAVPKA